MPRKATSKAREDRGPKPEINTLSLETITLDYRELEQLIEWTFGFEFDVLFAIGVQPDQKHIWTCAASGYIDFNKKSQLRTYNRLLRGMRTRKLDFIMQVLVYRKTLAPALYEITTDSIHPAAKCFARVLADYRDLEHPRCQRIIANYRGTKVEPHIEGIVSRWKARWVQIGDLPCNQPSKKSTSTSTDSTEPSDTDSDGLEPSPSDSYSEAA